MNQIKKFIDRISQAEARNTREVIMPLNEAKELRDELTKVLLDQRNSKPEEEVIEVVMRGGSYR
jgi:cytochrome c551/c552